MKTLQKLQSQPDWNIFMDRLWKTNPDMFGKLVGMLEEIDR